jgi:hypothetical protein
MRFRLNQYIFYALCFWVSGSLFSCSLEKDFEIELPALKPQLVAECYLVPGEPYRLTLTESTTYLADPEPEIVDDATVVILHNGQADTLRQAPYFDRKTRKIYTHVSKTIMTGKPGEVYTLQITDAAGRRLTGTTTVQATVPIDTVQAVYNSENKAYLLVKFMDPKATNYYYFSVHPDSLNAEDNVDYTADDAINNGNLFAFGTGYDFEKSDTAIVTLYHLEKPYYDFLNSVDNAQSANGNPFAQPAGIQSTVQGGLGVFTNLTFDRKVIILK